MPDAPDLTGVTAAPTASSTLQLLSPILETHLLPRLTLADIQNLEWVYRAAKETFLEDEDLLRIVQVSPPGQRQAAAVPDPGPSSLAQSLSQTGSHMQAHFPPALGWTQACEFRQQLQCTSQMQQALRAGQLQVTKQVGPPAPLSAAARSAHMSGQLLLVLLLARVPGAGKCGTLLGRNSTVSW